MRKKKIKPVSKTQFKKKVLNLLKRNNKVRILFQDTNDGSVPLLCSCLCKTCKKEVEKQVSYRRRVIDRKGNCLVAYKSDGYKSFSRYEESCFMDNYEQEIECNCNDPYDFWSECDCDYKPIKYSPKETLDHMLSHDSEDFIPLQIEYGKNFSKKIKLI